MREIVGIVGNARQSPVGLQPDPIYYLAQRQMPWCCPSVIVRAAGAPAALEADVRATVASLDRWLSLFDVRTGDGLLAIGVTAPRFLMTLLGGFAVIGLLLTAVGLYGVLNYAVVKQTREIGVRMALGASRADVVGMVLRKALLLVAAGTVIGIAGSLAGTRVIGSVLFGVEGRTAVLLAVAIAVILAAAVCAAYVPARRAGSIDPTVALRHE
jgi:putative ABC transport system permease protein